MLAKTIHRALQVTLCLDFMRGPLIHQLQPVLLRLFHRHETVRYFVLTASPPVPLLRRHIGSGNDALMRINKP